jgi:hypothetical protein
VPSLTLPAFILKENADSIVASLANQVEKTEALLTGGFALTKEMKLRKIRDMQTIDEQFEGLQRKVLLKKAQLKKAYNDAFNQELAQVNAEQENFEKHLSLINFSRETVVKTA